MTSQPVWLGLLRYALVIAGSYLTGAGYLSTEELDTLTGAAETIGGALLVAGPPVWYAVEAMIKRRRAKRS
ncbi:hypothetical protein [Methylobrevis pamukkalensis]|uniref:Uncharacterized protein n=1 Tax=Methylobrevis pamukkalensis TaxID=1439726 RepID=A0A1E3H0N7_9HYPH|nr:hypothetical protein [Methylobrevis pamukkalensis]ODN69893.1 hypothetical protein A6302_02775 [Methylobrevis pamukkalensis]